MTKDSARDHPFRLYFERIAPSESLSAIQALDRSPIFRKTHRGLDSINVILLLDDSPEGSRSFSVLDPHNMLCVPSTISTIATGVCDTW
jgi:hypothetical protein